MPSFFTIFLFILIALEFFIPLRTSPPVQILSVIFFGYAIYRAFTAKQSSVAVAPDDANSKLKTGYVYALLLWIAFIHCGAQVLETLSFQGTLWDLAQYIQQTYNYTAFGQPEATFPGQVVNYFQAHRSLSLEILKFINGGLLKFSARSTPFLIHFWNSIFLLAPGLVGIFWLKHIHRKLERPTSPFEIFLVVFLWLMNPTLLRMETWPYVFHILGPVFLALAYFFYATERWALWALFCFLLPYEKEDFAVVSCGFALTVILGEIVKLKGRLRLSSHALILSLLVIINGVFCFFQFHGDTASVIPFASRFSTLGITPQEVLINIFLRPDLVFRAVTRTNSLNYGFFFLFCSLLWLTPRWRALRFFLPILPLLFFNLIADHATMQFLKEMYALPIMVGLYATLILGVYPLLLEGKRSAPLFQRLKVSPLLFLPFLFALWPHQSIIRTFKEKNTLFSQSTAMRNATDWIKDDKQLLVCCGERICATFADRPYLLEARFCTKGHPLFDKFFNESGGRFLFVTQESKLESLLDIKPASK